jgi:prepilin-type N-terminal cleavage/methylation domain-containing protein
MSSTWTSPDVKSLRDEQGFTLVELLVSMMLLALLFGSFSTTVSSAIHRSGEITEQDTLQAEARGAMSRLVQDLRQGYTADGSPAIQSMGQSQITFRSPDRAQPFHLREISYQVAGGTLQRREAFSTNTDGPPWSMGPVGAWADQIGSIRDPNLFTFLDANDVPTTDPAAVREVDIMLELATNTSPATFSYTTSAELRTEIP